MRRLDDISDGNSMTISEDDQFEKLQAQERTVSDAAKRHQLNMEDDLARAHSLTQAIASSDADSAIQTRTVNDVEQTFGEPLGQDACSQINEDWCCLISPCIRCCFVSPVSAGARAFESGV